ncbi:MAG: hypothetical protein COB83_04020 [Gammaproteobacteria bacterium]|nr:MAG: hypothetical protein COB83_04020 [Gammaproteobacteria bacterium]
MKNKTILIISWITFLGACGEENPNKNINNMQPQRPVGVSLESEYLLLHINWNDRQERSYTYDDLYSDFNIKDNWFEGIDQERAEIMEEDELKTVSNRFLRVHYPENEFGPENSGISFRAWLPKLSTTNTTCVSFRARFKNDFVFSGMGKLGPGLAAGYDATGGNRSDGYSGFTSRLEWQTHNNSGIGAGRLAALVYNYNPDIESPPSLKYYSKMADGSDYIMDNNRWYLLEQCIKQNTFDEQGNAQPDGEIDVYVDGKHLVHKDQLVFRLTPQLVVDQLLFTTFFGGASLEYAADRDEYIDYADIYVTSQSISTGSENDAI